MLVSELVSPTVEEEVMPKTETKKASDMTPQERHDKFVRESRKWNSKVEESLQRMKRRVAGPPKQA